MISVFKEKIYTRKQLENLGLNPYMVDEIDMDAYTKDDEIYFFESVSKDSFRLFTIINKKSFFLK